MNRKDPAIIDKENWDYFKTLLRHVGNIPDNRILAFRQEVEALMVRYSIGVDIKPPSQTSETSMIQQSGRTEPTRKRKKDHEKKVDDDDCKVIDVRIAPKGEVFNKLAKKYIKQENFTSVKHEKPESNNNEIYSNNQEILPKETIDLTYPGISNSSGTMSRTSDMPINAVEIASHLFLKFLTASQPPLQIENYVPKASSSTIPNNKSHTQEINKEDETIDIKFYTEKEDKKKNEENTEEYEAVKD